VERTPPSEEWLSQVENAQWWKNAMMKSMPGSARYWASLPRTQAA